MKGTDAEDYKGLKGSTAEELGLQELGSLVLGMIKLLGTPGQDPTDADVMSCPICERIWIGNMEHSSIARNKNGPGAIPFLLIRASLQIW